MFVLLLKILLGTLFKVSGCLVRPVITQLTTGLRSPTFQVRSHRKPVILDQHRVYIHKSTIEVRGGAVGLTEVRGEVVTSAVWPPDLR
jgi:hypothetical protein